jgi:hypothetical protein
LWRPSTQVSTDARAPLASLLGALGAPTEVVYLATVAVVTGTNFVVFRHRIFHAKPALEDPAPAPIIERD